MEVPRALLQRHQLSVCPAQDPRSEKTGPTHPLLHSAGPWKCYCIDTTLSTFLQLHSFPHLWQNIRNEYLMWKEGIDGVLDLIVYLSQKLRNGS